MATLGLIFSGSHCKSDLPLTKHRAVASVPVGGRYRLIDFTLSNMVNDGITHIGLVTTFNYQSLMDHLESGKDWDLARSNSGLTFLPPYTNKPSKYNTRLESMKNIVEFIKRSPEEYVVLTDSYYMCNLELDGAFKLMFEKNADIVCIYRRKEMNEDDYYPIKSLKIDEEGRIIKMDFLNSARGEKDISLDIHIMRKDFLVSLIEEAIDNDLHTFNKDILAKNLDNYRVFGYRFDGWYGEVTSLQSYFDLNMSLLNMDVRTELFFNKNRPISTKVRGSNPTKFLTGSKVKNSTIADGCVIDGYVENCVLFRGVVVKKGAYLKNCIIMQDTVIGENAHLEYVITDKDAVISDGKQIITDYKHLLFVKKGERV